MIRPLMEKLEKELNELQHEMRHDLPREISKAKALGDLRENAEYQMALERQKFVPMGCRSWPSSRHAAPTDDGKGRAFAFDGQQPMPTSPSAALVDVLAGCRFAIERLR